MEAVLLMGQHKYTPTAIAAAKGELPPKKKPIGKREAQRNLMEMMYSAMLSGLALDRLKEKEGKDEQ